MTWKKHDLTKVIEQIQIGVAVTLPHGALEYANPHFLRWLGLGTDQLADANLARFRPDQGAFPDQALRLRLLAGESWQGETQFKTTREELRDALELIFPLHDPSGQVTHLIHFMQDIGALKLAENLSRLAFYDSLTGLPNRNLFNDRLSRAIAAARRSRRGFALLYVDIDRFKRINDTLGHAAGDDLLCQIAARLQGALRNTDTVARLGGDEFAVVLEQMADTGLAGLADRVVDKLLAACCDDYELGGTVQRVTLSIGVSLYPDDAVDTNALLNSADAAMYRAKNAGRNNPRLHEPRPSQLYGIA